MKVYSHSLHTQGWLAGLLQDVAWGCSICSSLLVKLICAGINNDTCRRQFAISIEYHLTCYKLQALSLTLAKSNAYSFHKSGLQPDMPSSAEVVFYFSCHRQSYTYANRCQSQPALRGSMPCPARLLGRHVLLRGTACSKNSVQHHIASVAWRDISPLRPPMEPKMVTMTPAEGGSLLMQSTSTLSYGMQRRGQKCIWHAGNNAFGTRHARRTQ